LLYFIFGKKDIKVSNITVPTSQVLNAIGLVLNTIAAIVLIIPNLNPTKKLDDDLIVSGDQKTGEYIQIKHLKESCINKIGLILLALGFIFQLIGLFL
jgi:hypothetical protein